jgi:hypothetical protein
MLKNFEKAKHLTGTWVHPDTTAEYTFVVDKIKVRVSGVDTYDDERFEISEVNWNGETLAFTSIMPSTDWRVTHRVAPNRGGTVNHEFTCTEQLRKKKLA